MLTFPPPDERPATPVTRPDDLDPIDLELMESAVGRIRLRGSVDTPSADDVGEERRAA